MSLYPLDVFPLYLLQAIGTSDGCASNIPWPFLCLAVPKVGDDDCAVLLRFENGARGILFASQIEVGEMNGLRIRLYGDKGGIVWKQELPNTLTLHNRLNFGGALSVDSPSACAAPANIALWPNPLPAEPATKGA